MTIATSDAEQPLVKPEWETPIHFLAEKQPAAPYPISALPTIIQNAVLSYQQYGQQPLPLIACSALSNVSLACQTLANVARDHLLVSPVSIYSICIGESGIRKTASDSTFGHAIRQWELKMRERLLPHVKRIQILREMWTDEKEVLSTQIRRATLKGEDHTHLKDLYLDLREREPEAPLLPVLFFEDATQEALASHIASGWPSASLWSDEGGIIIGSQGMQNNTTRFVSLLNRLWDGKPFIAHRKTSESFTVANRRLTVSLMIQPLILEQLLFKSGGISRQGGFLARSLIAYPQNTMGKRFYKEPPASLPALHHFHSRIIECLDTSASLDKNGCHELPLLSLNQKAKATWVQFFNSVEAGLGREHHWLSIKDFASKSAENAARLAALFHLFEGKEGQITNEAIEQAIQIIHWHLLETRRVLGTQPESIDQRNAFRLLQWLIGKSLSKTNPRYLQQYSPLREKPMRDKAISTLIEHNYLKETLENGRTILQVNPAVFEQI